MQTSILEYCENAIEYSVPWSAGGGKYFQMAFTRPMHLRIEMLDLTKERRPEVLEYAGMDLNVYEISNYKSA